MNMKKNKSMRLASFLLVGVLLTTSIISGVFAKYTTKSSAEDTARVAKWGVVTTMDASIFGERYGKNTHLPDVVQSDDAYSVKSSDDGSNVIAPGTKNDAFSYNITGTPEVDGVISLAVSGKSIYLKGPESNKGNSDTVVGTIGAYYRAHKVDLTEEQFAANEKLTEGKIQYYCNYGDDFVTLKKLTKWDPLLTGGSKRIYILEEDPLFILNKDYYPVVFSLTTSNGVDKNGINMDGISFIKSKFDTTNDPTTGIKNIPFIAGTTLDNLVGSELPEISWEWAFCNNENPCTGYDIEEEIDANNYKTGNYNFVDACVYCLADTMLGDVAAIGEVTLDSETLYVADLGKTRTGSDRPFLPQEQGLDIVRVGNSNVVNVNPTFDLKLTVTQTD